MAGAAGVKSKAEGGRKAASGFDQRKEVGGGGQVPNFDDDHLVFQAKNEGKVDRILSKAEDEAQNMGVKKNEEIQAKDEGKVDRLLSKAGNKSPDKGVKKPQAKDKGKVDRVLSKAGNKNPDKGMKKAQALAKKRPKTVGKKKS